MTEINTPKHIAPLAVFRIAFGTIMLISTLRFILKGWIEAFYIQPVFHFTFYGFHWVKAPAATGMYTLFALLVISSLLVTIGLFYRIAIGTFFLCFTYVELIDQTTYLNHYYLISVMAFLLILVPANRYFSADVWRKPQLYTECVPAWTINIFKLQLLLVYLFAGISKLNYDWLIAAMPLSIWLPASSWMPVIGQLLSKFWVASAFSWFGALFDLFIPFLLIRKETRKPAYIVVIIFHLATALFFKIGMFPYIMITVTTIFFSADTHLEILSFLNTLRSVKAKESHGSHRYAESYLIPLQKMDLIYAVLIIHFSLQLLIPLRYLLYPGKLYWTEEGYRFSWRVMLMEKGGTIFFHVKDPSTGRTSEITNPQYLTRFQENMMATQPDMILQYAHFLAEEYQKKGIKNPVVTAQSYVTLNGSGSRLYIDSTVNLANETESFDHKKWILPFDKN
ncbi:Vitamin K-dependent gamma-carboxylase [Pedobacter westerhofensis]|uniref:Vitamin K-dependent gamma-carboxylase n=1 Tax=Pedobacter westerhofensis TaxID=425512 RepID=A0A521ESA6_9SPHI|nr:HTTM domain-containing protein [Pedobacter westerhofensis]SMO86782.1 Vitamin K-dependent gamma-carboxylase [Pedobacter westerhofensis]